MSSIKSIQPRLSHSLPGCKVSVSRDARTKSPRSTPESCLTDDSQPQARLALGLASSSLLLNINCTKRNNKANIYAKLTTPNPNKTLSIMSGAAQGSQNTTKAVVSDSKDTSQPLQPQKPGAQLEEDDEFEDFPVEGMHTHIVNHLRCNN